MAIMGRIRAKANYKPLTQKATGLEAIDAPVADWHGPDKHHRG